jgi:acetoin utilization deacetylase AcuC-like enzyme
MVLNNDGTSNYSRSPEKPRLLREFLIDKGLYSNFNEISAWEPYTREDFLAAHEALYVDNFFAGVAPDCASNSLEWSKQFADSVRYTNASLYHAVKSALENPRTIALSPVSGFHHARPYGGSGFCTFSGQAIASLKLYRDCKSVGAYIDLDGHYGNSIEDTREFAGADLDAAVPPGFNINPDGSHKRYIADLDAKLKILEKKVLAGGIHYIVFCHGADSHEWDELGSQCTTDEWFECSKMVYSMVKRLDEKLGRPFPLALALFGGYRHDHYDSVLNLHAGDLAICLETLCGAPANFIPVVKRRY